MAVRYVKDFDFPSAAGYSKSSPSKVTGQMLAKGGQPKGMMVVIGIGKPKGPMKKAEGGKAVKVPLPTEDEAPYPSQWPMPSDEQINKENWNQRKAIRRAMGAKNTGKDTFAKGGMAHEDVAADKSLIKSMVKPAALKKAMGGQVVQMAKSNAIEASLKGQKKTGYADGGLSSLGGRPSPAVEMGKQYTPAQGSALQSMDMKGGAPLGMADPSQLASINKMMGSAGTPPDAQQQLAAFKANRAAQNMPKGGTPLGMANPSQKAAIGRMAVNAGQPPAGSKSVPVAPRSPMIPQQGASSGPRIGVGRSRSGKPNVGAIRAAMAKAATKSMPENAPEVMKKGGKVC
jgi:hypothetical protein